MEGVIEPLCAALSLAGAVLNVRRSRWGFVLWMIANAGWIAWDAAHGFWYQAAMFAAFFATAAWGWISWGRRGAHATKG